MRTDNGGPNGELRRMERRRKASILYMEGKTQWEIAVALSTTQKTISEDLATVRKQWLESSVMNFNERKAEELAKLDNLERLAMEGWLRSCEDAEIKKSSRELVRVPILNTAKKPTGRFKLVPSKVHQDKVVKGQAGDPRFIQEARECIKLRMQVFGMFEETSILAFVNQTNNTTNVIMPWQEVVAEAKRSLANNPVTVAMKELEDKLGSLKPRAASANGNGNGHHPAPAANGSGSNGPTSVQDLKVVDGNDASATEGNGGDGQPRKPKKSNRRKNNNGDGIDGHHNNN